MYEKQYVYLICDPDKNLFKVGVTKNLCGKRMKQLQTGNGTELHIANYHLTKHPFRVEKMLHNKFHDKREHGEWFNLEPEQVFSFKKYCEEIEELIKTLSDNPFFQKNLN